jgi:hypothetical protein
MSENIKFNKQVYDKGQYPKVIDTTFKQLIQPIADQIKSQPSVNDFFILYDTVFYLIPELGETNSHEYLIKKSSEYVNFEEDQTLIDELQKEISQLRIDLLDAQKQNVDLIVANPLSSNNLNNTNNTSTSTSTPGNSGGNSGGSGGSGGGGGY